jgi:hypothetical protein
VKADLSWRSVGRRIFGSDDVNPALPVLCFLSAWMFFSNHEDLPFRVLSVAMMLYTAVQIVRTSLARWRRRGRTRKGDGTS